MALNNGQGHNGSHQNPPIQEEEDDADAILASLEEEEDDNYRARRMQEIQNDSTTTTTSTTTAFDTTRKAYMTLKSDDETLSFTTDHARAIVHFFHPDFARCNTMDSHCELIAERHAEYASADVAFGRVDVKDAPFVVEKLGVRVLPCVIGFVKGVVKGRVTGFEGLCWDGKEGSMEVTRALEEAFVDWTVLRKRLVLGHQDEGSEDDEDAPDRRRAARGVIRSRNQNTDDDEDDWD